MVPHKHGQVWRVYRQVQSQAEWPCWSWYLLLRYLYQSMHATTDQGAHTECAALFCWQERQEKLLLYF